MKVEPRRYLYGFKTHSGAIHWQLNTAPYNGQREPDYVEHLTTVADVLAALRQPSEAMLKAGSHQGSQRYYSDAEVKNIFLDMLDAFEKDQSSPAKKAYEADNPLGGPARMFDAIAERIRSGEDYYAVLADYGVTVGAK